VRYAGWIIGGMYILDGLVSLLGGHRAIQWTKSNLGPSLPASWNRVLDEMDTADESLITTWGINNLIAGVSIVLVTSFTGGEEKRARLQPPEYAEQPTEAAIAVPVEA
jgi:hypothetical protein